ncbi:receptor-type tyrosine-protein phosphatase O isoform X2 [Xenopus laevis]|uniref:Receptor-type tyrosine-protein phosphatase O isoform X2 n=1 Tax=Xenopus laevis TaxID=8355 RepID=A0A8J0UPP5_XENLA|nr:receptor-type tyrosine-protein phosphatase O isoform X2 [Xenopus laevis]
MPPPAAQPVSHPSRQTRDCDISECPPRRSRISECDREPGRRRRRRRPARISVRPGGTERQDPSLHFPFNPRGQRAAADPLQRLRPPRPARVMILLTCLLLFIFLQDGSTFQVAVTDDNCLVISLEPSDVLNTKSVYLVKITGESKNYFFQFEEFNSTLPSPLVFNASYHGLYYILTLIAVNSKMTSRSSKSITVLTKPLPVSHVTIHDYKPSPQTGVVFQVQFPEKFNVFSRVNISYWEGRHFRTVLYKDFFKDKTVFNHWLPGTCYSNITLQLVSEASFNRSTLVEYSGVGHQPQSHRTVPFPPRNISVQILPLNHSITDLLNGKNNEVTVTKYQDFPESSAEMFDDQNERSTFIQLYNLTDPQYKNNTFPEATAQPFWWASETIPPDTEGFVNGMLPDYEDPPVRSSEPPSPSPNFKLLISWLPPKAPTAYDGFNIYIFRDGNASVVSSVDESTHEYVAELVEPGKYFVEITSFSSTGSCEIRESSPAKAISFYISPTGDWFEEMTEKPRDVAVKIVNSTNALVSWASSPDISPIVSVISLTCSKQKESQRLEKHYCKEVNVSSNIIGNLVPGAQYKVVVYFQRPPLIGPPSDAVLFAIDPTGIKDLVLFPLGPSAVILSWSRPYLGVFRKYIVEMFYFNPVAMSSEWTPYYEIAATVSLTASVKVTDLLPAWYYKFRVTMATWGEPQLSCCDTTVSFVTAPVAPQITSVEYSYGLLHVTWAYADGSFDLSHSRIVHWQVIAEGKKRIKKSVSRSGMATVLSVPAGDIYNITVTAFTERSSNTSLPHLVKLDPAPIKTLFAVNKTQTSVTLLWVEEGITDYFQVSCWHNVETGTNKNDKEPVTVFSHVVTISSLEPATSYNCSVTSISHRTSSAPTFITVSTLVTELNPNVVVISVLALLSILLIALLLLMLIVLRRKHLQTSRDCGAGTFVNFATLEKDGKLPYNWNKTGLKKRKLTNPVQLDDFDSYIKEMSKDSDYRFSLQFEELKMVGLDIPHFAANLPSNRGKNRYTNILPYDFSRVKLISLDADEGADYINANYIPGYSAVQEYIATQGPLPETRNDFWKMILQQKCQVIVMLTQCNEKRRIKCDHYWPFTSEPVNYGDITVEMVSEEEQSDWAQRVFRVSYGDESQCVTHFNFTAWPDHGVPTVNAAESVLHFVHVVRQKALKTKGPITVHCSAGVGRTGTFIALDCLMQHIRDHEFVDILGLVSELRSYRMSMVQTEEQFVFIHQCVQLMWKKKRQQFRISDVIYENVSKS